MKHARFYTALPRVGGRVRSNSASSSRALYTNPATLAFFDAPPPPPPNTRLTTHRLPIEARGEVEGPNNGNGNPHPTHAPLALAAPHAPGTNQHSQPGHAQLALLFPYTPGPLPKSTAGPAASSGGRAHRRRGTRYTLDVGAYGIPKRGHGHGHRGVRGLHTEATDAPLAVQVGEDAYFVRENAMGVADGVGGWARVKHPAPPSGSPSASALFARRLMHFCADEVDRASHPSLPQAAASTSRVRTEPVPVVQPWRPPPSRFAPYPPSASYVHAGPSSLPSAGAWPPPSASEFAPSSSSTTYASSYSDPWRNEYSPYDPYVPAHEEEQEWDEYDEHASPADALAAELDELADGLDVLHILERAYERTLTAHVVPAPASPSTSPSASAAVPTSGSTSMPIPTAGKTGTSAPTTRAAPTAWPFTKTQTRAEPPPPKTIPLLAGSSTALVAVLDYVPAAEVDVAIVSSSSSATATTPSTSATAPKPKGSTDAASATASTDAELTPVLKIAHVGDCMGMLVRDGEVAWRSEEMWWRWNTPVQLSAAPAHTSASTSTTSPAPAAAGSEIGKVTAGKAGWWTSFVAPSSSSAPTPTSHSHSPIGGPTPTTANGVKATQTQVTPSSAAHLFTLPVQAGDIVILASDGLSDNLWDEDVLEEVGRVRGVFAASSASVGDSGYTSATGEEVFEMGEIDGGSVKEAKETRESAEGVDGARLRRQTLAGMLSEALCSRARRVATRRVGRERGRPCSNVTASSLPSKLADVPEAAEDGRVADEYEDDTPFARRARETGRVYRGGKNDDISVIVAVIAPAEEHAQRGRGRGRGRVEAARAAGS